MMARVADTVADLGTAMERGPLSRRSRPMLPHARAPFGAVLIVAVLAVAGCGSSSPQDDKPPAAAATTATTAAKPAPAPAAQTGPAPSKAVYVRRADKVCRDAREVSQSANTVVQKAFAAKDLNKAAEA